MAGYGSQPGERRGGRPIGGKNKLTLEREREISDVVAVMDRPLGPGNAIPPGDLNAENDRADGRASFLRAPDTVAPPVALEPDNSPYRSPRSPATKRFQPASNLFPGPAALRSLGAGLSLRRLG